MRRAPEPFVIRHDAASTADRPTRLADVLITESDGRPRLQQLAGWFGECPGLTLVMLVGADRTVEIGARDGVVASLRLDPSTSVELAAVVLYHSWIGQFGTKSQRSR